MQDSTAKQMPQNEKLVLERSERPCVRSIVEEARQRGWKRVTVRGELDARRAVWVEGSLLNIEVKGYEPSIRDREEVERLKNLQRNDALQKVGHVVMKASDVVLDYSKNVLPKLNKDLEDLRQLRFRFGGSQTDLDKAYDLNRPKEDLQWLEAQTRKARASLLSALEAREQFISLGQAQIKVSSVNFDVTRLLF